MKQFIDWFTVEYEQTIGRAYVVAGGKDGQLIKSLLGKVGARGDALAELQRAARNMFADPWGKDRADIGLLSSKINTWLADPATKGAGTPSWEEKVGAASLEVLGDSAGRGAAG